MDTINRKRRDYRYMGRVIDIINIILACGVLLGSVMVIINMKKNMFWFPVVFFCSAFLNLALGIKYLKRKDTVKAIALFMAALFFLVMGIFGIIAA